MALMGLSLNIFDTVCMFDLKIGKSKVLEQIDVEERDIFGGEQRRKKEDRKVDVAGEVRYECWEKFKGDIPCDPKFINSWYE